MGKRKADQPAEQTPAGAVNVDNGGRPVVDRKGRPSTDGYTTPPTSEPEDTEGS